MSFPNIPNVTPTINLSREEVVNLLLASIAFEELGLAHIINAEAEKVQAVVGTLPNTSLVATNISELLSINKSVNKTLKTVIKKEMLLQFKLEDIIGIIPETTTTTTTTTTTSTTTTSTTTETTTTTTTTSTTTTSTTTETTTTTTTETTTSETTTTASTTTACAPGLQSGVFANRNFTVDSQSVVNANTQVNGNMTVNHIGNDFIGNTIIVGTLIDTAGSNLYGFLNVGATLPVPLKTYNIACLQASADIIINGDVDISDPASAAVFQGNTVFVNGSVTVSGGGITIVGGGIIATGNILVSGGNFTYLSTDCFALYSQTGNIDITNGPYTIIGLIYTANTTSAGDINLSAPQGGSICGALISGRDINFSGGTAVHDITNTGFCSPCQRCNDICPGP